VIRKLGLEAFGNAQYVINLIEFCVPFVLLGYNQYGTVRVGKNLKDVSFVSATMGEMFTLKLVNVVMVFWGFYLLSFFSTSISENLRIILLSSFFLVFSAMELNWMQTALQRTGHFALQQLVIKLIAVFFFLSLIDGPEDSHKFVFLFLGTNAAIAFWTTVSTLKFFKPIWPTLKGMKKIFADSWLFGIPAILVMAFDRVDLFFAQYYMGGEGVASLVFPAKLAQSLSGLMLMLAAVKVSEAVGEVSVKERFRKTEIWLNNGLKVLIPMVPVCIFFFPFLVGVFTANLAPASESLVAAVATGSIASFVNIVLVYQYFLVEERLKECIKILAFCFVLLTVLLIAGGHKLDIVGIVWTCVCAKAVASITLLFSARDEIRLEWMLLLKVAVAVAALTAVLLFFFNLGSV
jgi:O-antigen/teichoic acid export membrane protein